MNIEECYYLGYVSKAIGNKGELAFKLDVDSPSSYEGLDMVLVQMAKTEEILVPFFVTDSLLLNNSLLRVSLEDISNQEQSKELIGKALYLPLTALPPLTGNHFYFHEVIGYTVIDKEHGLLGPIKQVLDYPAGSLLEVHKNGKEILIPLLEDTLIHLDRQAKTMEVQTPEGLIDLYLQ